MRLEFAPPQSLAISRHFTVKTCVAERNCKKFTKTPYFGRLRSFKVIDIDTPKNLVINVCYDKQHVCAYLQPFFMLGEPMAVKYELLVEYPSLPPSFEGNQGHEISSPKLEFLWQPTVKIS